MHFIRCRMAMNRLFIYLRQNSHTHNRPSGTRVYSSGNGAWNQVSMSYAPKRIIEIGIAYPLAAAVACVLPIEGSTGVAERLLEGEDADTQAQLPTQ